MGTKHCCSTLKTWTCYLIVPKSDKSKSTERLWNEDVCDFSILHEELPQVICGHVFGATAHKHFPAPQRLIQTLLLKERWWETRILQVNEYMGVMAEGYRKMGRLFMDITRFTFELGSLQSHHLPSIMWRCEITFSCASYSVNLTKPKPLEFPVFASLFTCTVERSSRYGADLTNTASG